MKKKEHETTDALTRRLRIIQRQSGHKAASDDVLLAWAGLRAVPQARRILDLGSGKGTVALLLLGSLPDARAVGVEAYPGHHDLAVRNAALNRLGDRYDARLGDLRDPSVLEGEAPFDLICGAPPYHPVGSGVLPRDPGRAAGRFELRGGVEAYARTAARHLAAPEGRFVLLMNGAGRARAESAVGAAGLAVCRLVAVRPRPSQLPTYWLIEAAAEGGAPVEEELCMRQATGMQWSPAYAAVRAALDLPEQ
ncbi:MAG: tRNA1(Val) (adenine(37)-N6)-methyltransferase [Acidobacteriota bacterium]